MQAWPWGNSRPDCGSTSSFSVLNRGLPRLFFAGCIRFLSLFSMVFLTESYQQHRIYAAVVVVWFEKGTTKHEHKPQHQHSRCAFAILGDVCDHLVAQTTSQGNIQHWHKDAALTQNVNQGHGELSNYPHHPVLIFHPVA